MQAQSLFPVPPAAVSTAGPRSLSAGRTAAISAHWLSLASDVVVAAAIQLSIFAAPLLMVGDWLLRPRRTLRLCVALHRSGLHPLREMRRIWFTRAAREAIRVLASNGLTAAVLRRVVVVGNAAALDGPAVLAVYHTPWARLLALWLSAQERMVLLAGELWSTRAAGAHLTSDSRGMRQLLRELKRGCAAAVTVDHFGERGRITSSAEVLGTEVDACAGAARLAARAGVPLVPVALRWHRGRLEIRPGHRFTVTRASVGAAMGAVICEFNVALAADVSSWANAHRFLSSRHSGAVRHRPLGMKQHDVARSGDSAQDQDL